MAKRDKPEQSVPKDQWMIFSEDMFYDDLANPLYDKGTKYLVPGNMVDRWLMRGGMLVDEPNMTKQHVPIDPDLAKQHQDEMDAKEKEEKTQEKTPEPPVPAKGNKK